MKIYEIVKQLESCNYTCEAGPLVNNSAFVALKEMAEKESTAVTMDSEDETQQPRLNIPYCKSPLSVKEFLKNNIHDDFAEYVADVLSCIGKKGATVEGAVYVLDQAKIAVRKCTILQDEYKP